MLPRLEGARIVRSGTYAPVATLSAQVRHRMPHPASFVGRLLTAGASIGLIIAATLALPPERAEIALVAAIGLVIVTARSAGFWASVVTAFVAAAMIDVALLSPGDNIIVGSIEDIGVLAMFLLVAVLGARTSTDRSHASALRRMGNPAHQDALAEPLTGREIVVLRLLAQGKSNEEIADELVVSRNTVKTHLSHVYGKLGVSTRTQAIVRARELDLDGGGIHPNG